MPFVIRDQVGSERHINVVFEKDTLIKQNVLSLTGQPFSEGFRQQVATAAILSAVDSKSDIFNTPSVKCPIVLNADNIIELLQRSKISDRELRRYLTRRIYLSYSQATLKDKAHFGDVDHIITGARISDIVRNLQVLEEEGYLELHLTEIGGHPIVTPKAKLVREVERFGGPKEDVVTEQDYISALNTYDSISSHRESILGEYRRYTTARTSLELTSVFRGIAPCTESIAREMLIAHGCKRDLSTLGPIIKELHARKLGGVALISQLNHVLKFGRDLTQHGNQLPEPVLRIACENAFQLIPQLASMFPK